MTKQTRRRKKNPRPRLTRDFYIPQEGKFGFQNVRKITRKGVNGVVYTYERGGRIAAMAFGGKRSKPDWQYSFLNEESRKKRIDDFFAGLRAHAKQKEERKKKRKAYQHKLEVGDILVASWGYEQTNVDFYQVVKVPTKKTVVIRPIAQKDATPEDYGGSSMSGYVLPVKGAFLDKPEMKKRVGEGDSVKLTSYSWAWKWDGKPKYTSWYG